MRVKLPLRERWSKSDLVDYVTATAIFIVLLYNKTVTGRLDSYLVVLEIMKKFKFVCVNKSEQNVFCFWPRTQTLSVLCNDKQVFCLKLKKDFKRKKKYMNYYTYINTHFFCLT